MDFFSCIARRTRARRKRYDEIFRNGGDASNSECRMQHKSRERSPFTAVHHPTGLDDFFSESDGEIKVLGENHGHDRSTTDDDNYTSESEDDIEVLGESKGSYGAKQLEDDVNEKIDAKGCDAMKITSSEQESEEEDETEKIDVKRCPAMDISSSSEQESEEEEDENEIIDGKGCAAMDITSSSEQESEVEEDENDIIDAKGFAVVDIVSSSEHESEEEGKRGNANCDIKNDAIEQKSSTTRKNCETDASLTQNSNPTLRNYNFESFRPATTRNSSESTFKIGNHKKTSEMESDSSFDSSDDSSSTETEYDDPDDDDYEIERHDTSVSMESSTSYEEEGDEEDSVSVDVASNDPGNREGTARANGSKRINLDDCNNEENSSCEHNSKRREPSNRDSQIRIDVPLEPFKEDSANRTGKFYEETKERTEKISDTKANGRKQLEDVTREDAEGPEKSKRLPRPGTSRLKILFPPTWSHDDEFLRVWSIDSNSDHELLSDSANRVKRGEGEASVNKAEARVSTRRKQATIHEDSSVPKRRRQVYAQDYDTFKILADSILHKEDLLEKKESEQKAERSMSSEDPLILKFRFKDESPKKAEKSEYEKMMDGLFSEMRIAQTYEEMGSFEYSAVGDRNVTAPEAEEHPSMLCAKGKHHLVFVEEIGLRCLYCLHVELEWKCIRPPWGRKVRDSEWKRSASNEQFLVPDGLNFEASSDNLGCFSDRTTRTIWDIIPGVRDKLFHHQQEGFEFLWKNLAGTIDLSELQSADSNGVGGCIISHAPGTGKTRLTIVFIESYLKLFPNSRPVIIAPASMLLTWEQEFRKWEVNFPFHNLNNLEFSVKENKTASELFLKTKGQNKDEVRMVKMYSWKKEKSVLGISYSLYEKLAGEKSVKEKGCKKGKTTTLDEKSESMRKILLEMPGLVVLDEGHTPRNQRSRIWNTLLKLETEKRIILSGTPFQNNFGELFNTLHLVRPAIADVLGKEKTFSEIMSRGKFLRKQSEEEGASLPGYRAKLLDSAIQKLKATIEPFVHVHKGKILQQSLPGLIDSLVLLNPPPLQKFLIEKLEGSPQNTFEFEHKVALISTHPYLFKCSGLSDLEKDGVSEDTLETLRLNPEKGVKTRFIMELVRLSTAMEEKVLIFSQYIHPLDLIRDQLQAVFNWDEGKQVLQMQGKLDQKQRLNLINVFNDPDSEAKVMLASTKCCSEGISLIGASRVVLLDVVWNPSVERQAISRAYRLGQTKLVYTYHLMTSGTTEADKYCRQAEKDRLSELVFSSTTKEGVKKHQPTSFEDRILGEMVDHAKLQDMFEKVIYQPKEANLMEDFGLLSS